MFPNLKFTIKRTSFADLARDDAHFLESDEWGATKVGSHHLYRTVQELVGKGIIVRW